MGQSANDTCPGGCQSWVATTVWNLGISPLMAAPISSPRGTGIVPPRVKSFWKSTMISARRGAEPLATDDTDLDGRVVVAEHTGDGASVMQSSILVAVDVSMHVGKDEFR